MAAVREYLLGVIAAGFICGMLTSLTKATAAASLIRLLCGVFLTVCILSPVHQVDFDKLLDSVTPDFERMHLEIDRAQMEASDALRDIIKQETEAYVLDKAAQLGASVTVEVRVSEDTLPVPESILLRGNPSPYIRLRLEQLIVQELGIPEEAQTWVG